MTLSLLVANAQDHWQDDRGWHWARASHPQKQLESLLVELTLRGTDAATTSFASTLEVLTVQTGSGIEFDIRIDRDVQIQRLASVTFAGGRRVVLALSVDGQQILQAQVTDAVDEDFFEPLVQWFALPMREKPHVSIDAAAALLLGALRSKGLLPIRNA